MARRRQRRPHDGQTTEAGSGRRRAPFSTDTASHTHTSRSLACPLLTLFASARSFSNGIFRSDGAPCARPLLPSSDRSAGQRNQPSHSTVLTRPVCLFVCVGDASLPCARPLLPSSDRSAGQRNQPSHSTVLARPVCPFVCVSDASFPCRFPDERTPIEATPLSATSTELGLGWGLGLGLDSLSHSSSHALSFLSTPSFHTLSLSPAFTSVWWSA
jgi:hypothetical protein